MANSRTIPDLMHEMKYTGREVSVVDSDGVTVEFSPEGLKSYIEDSSSLPTGSETQTMGFDSDGNPIAKAFTPEMWTDMPSGPPTEGTWLAAYAPGQSPEMAFAPATSTPTEGQIPIYDTIGMLQVTGGSDDGHAASVGQLNTRFSQAMRDAIDGLDPDTSSIADIINALKAVD